MPGQRNARVLFICGSNNQTTQLHRISEQLPELEHAFTPYYGTRILRVLQGTLFPLLADATILGERRRAMCLEYLRKHDLPVDRDGESGPYDLVVTCSDVVMPENVRKTPIVLVQEGITDPDHWLSRVVRRAGLPIWMAGSTTLTGLSGLYDRFCVASEGYREFFVARGARPEKLRVTGIPNFDDCRRYCDNDLPFRHYVLACTSDLRETFRRDDRRAFIERVKRIANGRPVRFKLHPNERVERARREIDRWLPGAAVHTQESAEALIANCDALVTQVSSVVFVGIALGKPVYSDMDLGELRKLCPVQNGGRSAASIADVCRELLGTGARQAAPPGSHAAQAVPLREAVP
jgi:hypothetical protein